MMSTPAVFGSDRDLVHGHCECRRSGRAGSVAPYASDGYGVAACGGGRGADLHRSGTGCGVEVAIAGIGSGQCLGSDGQRVGRDGNGGSATGQGGCRRFVASAAEGDRAGRSGCSSRNRNGNGEDIRGGNDAFGRRHGDRRSGLTSSTTTAAAAATTAAGDGKADGKHEGNEAE